MPASPQIVARSLCRWLHDAGYRGPYGRAHACTRALASWRNSTPPDPHTGPGILTGLFTFFREALYRRGILLLEHLGCKDVATPWCHAFVECCPSLRYKVRQIRGSLDRAEGMGDVNDFGFTRASSTIITSMPGLAWQSGLVRAVGFRTLCDPTPT